MKRHPCDLYLSNVAREVLGDGVAEQVAREVLTLAEHQGWDQSCCYIKHFGDVESEPGTNRPDRLAAEDIDLRVTP